jgi:hypothetical protein
MIDRRIVERSSERGFELTGNSPMPAQNIVKRKETWYDERPVPDRHQGPPHIGAPRGGGAVRYGLVATSTVVDLIATRAVRGVSDAKQGAR